jgi:site-specific recombinase XerD
MSNSTFKTLFVVRKSNSSKDGTVAISIRITIEGDSLEFSSKIRVSPNIWDANAGRAKGRTRAATDINDALDKITSRLHSKYKELEDKYGYVTPELLKNAFLGIAEKKTTLLLLMDRKIDQKKALVGNTITKSAMVKYEDTRKKLEEFILIHNKTADISIKGVNYDFITAFDIHLRSKHGLHHNTVVKFLRYLKQITTEAIKSGLMQIDPFMNITLSSKKGHRKYLTKEELRTVMSQDFASDVLKEARDVFVFQCYTGFAYVDVSKLTIDDVIVGADKKQFIIKDRTKTGVESFVPLFEIPLKIIKKYRKRNLPDRKLLPVSSCQVLNRYLKEIAGLCGIQKTLSSHCGRHTFATLMLTEGISVESVSRMLGHTDIKTTQIYARILNEKVISETSKKETDVDSLSDLWQE